jgi:hypothetical protein
LLEVLILDNSSNLLGLRRFVGYSSMECSKFTLIFMRWLLGRLGSSLRYYCFQTYKSSNCQNNLGITGMCFSVKRGSITMMDLAQIDHDPGLERVCTPGEEKFSTRDFCASVFTQPRPIATCPALRRTMASSYWQVTEEIQPQPLRLPFSILMQFLPDRNPVIACRRTT